MYSPRLRSLLLLTLFGLSVLSAPPARADDDEVEVEGVIEALGDETLTVGGFTFLVTAATEIDGGDGDVGFEDLAVGQFVEVEGFYTADGTLVAEEIEVEDDDDGGDEVEVEGLITALADDGLTVSGLFFLITGATEIEGDDGDISFEDLAVGQFAEVEGHYDASGALVADEIEVDESDEQEVDVEGTIEALGDASLTVGGFTFSVTDDTEIEGDDIELTFADLAVGQLVEVEGFYAADGTLVAREIEVEDFDDDEIEVEGAIEDLGDATITVLGLTFAVTDATVIRGDEDEPILFSELTIGLVVEVHGTNAGGALVATRIEVEDGMNNDDEVELKAALGSVGDEMIVVLGRAFLVLPTTPILGLDDEPIALGDLAAGDVVEVDARLEADGSLTALRIERDDDPANLIRLQAAVTSVGTSTVDVIGIAFLVDEATVIVGPGDAPITLADLVPGQRVDVDAFVAEGGVRRATRIEVEPSGRAAGRVATTGTATFGLPGLRVDYAADVLFVDESGAVFDPGALASGQAVRVSGAPGAQATLVASRVVVLGVQNPVASEGNAAPLGFEFDAVYPNPFAAQATVRYTLDRSAHVTLTVLDVRGREVRRLADASRAAGTHTETLDASGLSNGVYFVTLDVEGAGRVVRKTVLTR
ncbi:MAG: DUF5666 domain-containing protein [Rhodothermales bacterium]